MSDTNPIGLDSGRDAVGRDVTGFDAVIAAQHRLAVALDALDAAAERRREADRGTALLATQVHSLGSDRAKLAGELDDATARARTLESATRDVAQRIDTAIETIRSVLALGE